MLANMTPGKALAPERNERLREIVRSFVAEMFDGNVTRAAARIGVSQPLLSEFLAGGRGAGPKLLEGLADALGRSVDDLLGRPAPASAGPAATAGIIAAREEAITEMLIDYPDDPLVREAVEEVRSLEFRTKRDLDKAWFLRAIHRHREELRALDAASAAKKRSAV
jgi:transcriptional regulator with XRE-family HTH domain